jgi:hypothetical protein
MSTTDQFGVRHSSADAAAVARLGCASGVDSGLVGANVLRDLANARGTDHAPLPAAADPLAVGRFVERAHLQALEAWIGGWFSAACAIWEQFRAEELRHALAMFAAHQGD